MGIWDQYFFPDPFGKYQDSQCCIARGYLERVIVAWRTMWKNDEGSEVWDLCVLSLIATARLQQSQELEIVVKRNYQSNAAIDIRSYAHHRQFPVTRVGQHNTL